MRNHVVIRVHTLRFINGQLCFEHPEVPWNRQDGVVNIRTSERVGQLGRFYIFEVCWVDVRLLIAGDFPGSDKSVDIWRGRFSGTRSFHVPPEDPLPCQPGKLVVTGNFWLQLVLLMQEVFEHWGWLLTIP